MKKNIFRVTVLALLAAFLFSASIFAAPTHKSEVKIKTSAQTWMNKNQIETKLKKLDGVEDAYLSLKDRVVTIKIDNDKIKSEELTKSITNMGYDADFITEQAVNDDTPTETTPSTNDTRKN